MQIQGFELDQKKFEIRGFLQIVGKFSRFMEFQRILQGIIFVVLSITMITLNGLDKSLCNHRFWRTCWIKGLLIYLVHLGVLYFLLMGRSSNGRFLPQNVLTLGMALTRPHYSQNYRSLSKNYELHLFLKFV